MRIPVYILTGFLGAGKTTLLNSCLSNPKFADSAVLINEFGEIGLDHLLVRSVDEEIIVLESGCICCTVRDDFTAALLGLASRRDRSHIPKFRRVVLETTGVADPNAVHQLLLTDPEIRKRFHHAGTVTVVDGVFGFRTLEEHPEAVLQVASADRLVISKTDKATAEQIVLLENQLATLNPEAVLRLGPSELSELIESFETEPLKIPQGACDVTLAGIRGDAHVEKMHNFCTFRVTHANPLAWEDLKAWLETLLFAHGDDIYRIKGWVSVKCESLPVVVQTVRHAIYPSETLDEWPSSPRRTDLTFICRNFNKTAAMRSLMQFCDCAECTSVHEHSRWTFTDSIGDTSPVRSVVLPHISERLTAQLYKIDALLQRRPWHRWSLHNPWSQASTVIDSWEILAACQEPELLDAVGDLIGSDIVLFDTQVLSIAFAERDEAWNSDVSMFPVDPVAGAVVRLPLRPMPGMRFSVRASDSKRVHLEAESGRFIFHDAALVYRYEDSADRRDAFEFVIRFFPASSHYQRDPSHPAHRALTERFPLCNYARSPLWLVRGEDRSSNDFVSGFQVKSGYWTAA